MSLTATAESVRRIYGYAVVPDVVWRMSDADFMALCDMTKRGLEGEFWSKYFELNPEMKPR